MVNEGKSSILVVDDTETNIDVLLECLADEYDIRIALDGESALEQVESELPDLILLDVMMPGMDGYQVCERLKFSARTLSVPVIFLTALSGDQDEARGLALGAVDYITKPFNAALVKARVRNHLDLKRHRDHLQELVDERTREIELTQEITIESLATLAEYRDSETGGHIKRTQSYIRLLARHLASHPKFCDYLDEATITMLYKSAPLHDIGKVGVPDNILLKPGKLTNDEFETMKLHTVYGCAAIATTEKRLGSNSFLSLAGEIAETHHERWDGTGYPKGLKGEQIPISGRLMAVADVYDALISKRCYKPPYPHSQAVSIILEDSGTHFDPDIVKAFEDLSEKFRGIALEYADYETEREALRS